MLLSYEYEATTAQKKGEDVDYVVPDDTIKIDIDIATTKDAPAAGQGVPRLRPVRARARSGSPTGATARSTRRSWRSNADKFPTPSGLFTIEDLGGWAKVNDELFDPEKGSIAKIEEDAGVSTAK